MNREIELKLWELIKYAQDSIHYASMGDEHWETTLSLTMHSARELKTLINKEE
tara:strand:+ start:3275 stop:3433 length:159 start_codon:yes stop_codon:yes gene_type:complete